MVAPVVYVLIFKAGLHLVSFETASRDAQTLNLSRNMSKFYVRQVGSWMNQHQSQNLLLKVDPLSVAIRNNELNTRGDKLETSAKLRVLIVSLPSVKAAIYEIAVFFLVFRLLLSTVQDINSV